MWYVEPYSMSSRVGYPAVPQETKRSCVVQLGSQWVEYGPMYHTYLVFFLCQDFNHFSHWNILNWGFCSFEKAYHMVKKGIPHDQKYVVCPYISCDACQILYHVICQQPWHKGDLLVHCVFSELYLHQVLGTGCIGTDRVDNNLFFWSIALFVFSQLPDWG